ncbi:MAG: hypothetical protein RL322_1556 [Pseudomonadota bacterium]
MTAGPPPPDRPTHPRSISLLTDRELAQRLNRGGPADTAVTDEYYRRVIPLFRATLGVHWHTGFHLPGHAAVGPDDQIRMIEVVTDSIGVQAGSRVLDVGCGIGGTLVWLARSRGIEAIGLTPVEEQRLIGQQLIAQHGAGDRAHIVLGHADRLPFPDESFDAVLFFESACHFPDRAAFFREAMRVLRRGGAIAGEDWTACEGLSLDQQHRLIQPIERTWSIPALGTARHYCGQMVAAGFDRVLSIDLKSESNLRRAFMADRSQQIELMNSINTCTAPLEQLVLEGFLRLGQALAEDAFTITRFSAHKPA